MSEFIQNCVGELEEKFLVNFLAARLMMLNFMSAHVSLGCKSPLHRILTDWGDSQIKHSCSVDWQCSTKNDKFTSCTITSV